LVHVFSLNGINIAVDGNSGCIHMVDETARAILQEFDRPCTLAEASAVLSGQYQESNVREAWTEIETLYQEGLLFSRSIEPDELPLPAKPGQNLKALCLHVAHDCNLACSYCFASKGSYRVAKNLMPGAVAFKAVDFLAANSGNKKNIEIDFFGGEPTLNFQVVKDTVDYSRQVTERTGKHFHFTITTNGTLLNNDIINYINNHMDNVVISLDGRPEIHNGIRRTANGKETYHTILPDALRLIKTRGQKSYFVRGTFTSHNTDFYKDVLHLADAGFAEISMEPVVGSGKELHLNNSHLPEILNSYEQLAGSYLDRIQEGRPFKFYHFNVDIYQGPCLAKRTTACGAGTEYLAVTPEGDLYPCHQFVGEPAFKMGNLDTGITDDTLGKQFGMVNIFTKETCRTCWAKLFCSGGCHANAYYTNRDITQPEELFCVMQKKRLECALMIEAWKENKCGKGLDD